ncbi:MAG: regulatory protein RecX [Bacteroidales bacterium]|nr:regulatory protein RecX [Candidatus Colimorpha onthohippi]
MNLALRDKAARYCAVEDRCSQTVRRKLREWGATPDEEREIVDYLIAECFVDDMRYARTYCGSKLRYQHWGRIKVAYQLRINGIDSAVAREVVQEVMTDEEYVEIMRRVADTKWASLRVDVATRRVKVISFLVSRGYELDLAKRVVCDIQ